MTGKGSQQESGSGGLAAADDGALLRAAQNQNTAAFAELVRRHYAAVHRVSWRMCGGGAESEDIAQEAFLKLWQNPAQVREAGALKGWLMRVASNAAIDRGRRRRLESDGEVPDVADARELADTGLDRQRAARLIDSRIAALPDRQRQALTLVHFEGLSNIEAATAMEVSIDALESLLARARRGLRQSLDGQWRQLLDGLSAGTS